MDDMEELPNRPKTAPPSVKERNDTVNQYDDERSTTGHPDHQVQTGPSPQRISSSELDLYHHDHTLPRVDVSENPKRDGGRNERGLMVGYPPRQFAATPDSERSPVVVVDEMTKKDTAREKAVRNDDAGVSEIVVEPMSTTKVDESRKEEREEDEYQGEADDEEEMDDNLKRKPFETVGKPVERVASPMKPRPSSPIPGAGRRPQIPFMAYVVRAAVEKNKLDDVLGPDQSIYEQSSTKYSSLLTPHEKHANKMSLVAEIMQTDSYGNKLQRTPSTTGRYQPIGTHANDFSLLRPCEMNLYAESRSRLDMQRSASKMKKDKENDDVQVKKETEGPEKKMASKVLGKLWGKAGSNAEPVTTEEKKTATTRGADSNEKGLASTAGVLTSVIRWKTKKLATKTRDSHEKYPGYLDLFNRLSHELNTSVPFPILLQTRREALPIIHSIAKAYKSTLGPHHQMTEEAYAKVEKLRSELQDNDVFL